MAEGEAPSKWWTGAWWNADRKLTVVIGVLGIVVAVAFGVLPIELVKDTRDPFNAYVFSHLPRYILMVGILIAVAVLSLLYMRTSRLTNTTHDNARLKDEVAKLTADVQTLTAECDTAHAELEAARAEADKAKKAELIPYPKDARGRWSSLKEVKFGHLDYEPFLNYVNGRPVGLGVRLLRSLLKVQVGGKLIEVEAYGSKCEWSNVLSGLINHEYDVVATPLFATFDRSRQVAFTSPLFFSDVGLYVRSDLEGHFAVDGKTGDDLEQAIRKAQSNVKLKFLGVEGEISKKLADKYAEPGMIEENHVGTLLGRLFERLTGPEPGALFCESFFADYQPEVKSGKVVNVLQSHQILYPVGFAVRIGDYQLRNLLNIRLLHITREQSALTLLKDELKEIAKRWGEDLSDDDIKKHFVAEWPSDLPLALKDGTNG